jgi:hypothetical protein
VIFRRFADGESHDECQRDVDSGYICVVEVADLAPDALGTDRDGLIGHACDRTRKPFFSLGSMVTRLDPTHRAELARTVKACDLPRNATANYFERASGTTRRNSRRPRARCRSRYMTERSGLESAK